MDDDEKMAIDAYGSITIVKDDGSTFEASSEEDIIDQMIKDIAKKGAGIND